MKKKVYYKLNRYQVTKVEVETRTVDANTVLPAKLYGSGGLAIRLEPAEPGKR